MKRTIPDIPVVFLHYDTEACLIFCFGAATAEIQDWGLESSFQDERWVENKSSFGYIFKLSPRWRHPTQVGNMALMLRGEVGAGDIDLVINTVESTVRAIRLYTIIEGESNLSQKE